MNGNRGTNSGEPPPIPPDAPPAPAAKRGGLSTTAIVLIVCGVLAIPVVAGVVGAVSVMVPKMQETARRTTCMSNLSELRHVYIVAMLENGLVAQRYSGSSLWLAMRKSGTAVRPGQEKLLLCPGDPAFEMSSSQVAGTDWEALDLADPPPGLCSYAGRDFVAFPIDYSVCEKHVIGACVHHRGGAVVAFDEGDVQFMTREDLGLAPDDPIVVGPESKSPLLRTLLGGN